MNSKQPKQRDFFLPDFCSLNSVLAVVVLSQLFALILTLGAAGSSYDPWSLLALTSLFMQWAGLSSALLLCMLRNQLARLSGVAAALTAYLLLLLLILLLSEVAYRISVGFQIAGATPHHEFLLRNLAIATIVVAIALRYFYVQHQWKRRIRTEAEARLQALQARIRPHFLFNSINTVTSLVHERPEQAEEALLDLSDLFRAGMGDERRLIPFADELALTRRYLHMEGLRLGERLQVDWDIAAIPGDAMVPPLLLQPLVENAVYHGIEPSREGGTIRISGALRGNRLCLTLCNPLPSDAAPRKNGNRLALQNIRDRLDAHYGRRAGLEIEESGEEYRVILSLPLEVEA